MSRRQTRQTGQLIESVKERLGEKLVEKYCVWEDPEGRKEYPLPYRTKEMRRRPSSDICLYSKNLDELVLIEVDRGDVNILNSLKFLFIAEEVHPPEFELLLKKGAKPERFEPDQVRVFHFIPSKTTPFAEKMCKFLAKKIREKRKIKFWLKKLESENPVEVANTIIKAIENLH